MSAAAATGFRLLAVTMPCCQHATTLNDLHYSWPAGFASFVLSAVNPDRSWLQDAELQNIAEALGHPLRQILTHY
jgi:hypothetical protein